MRLAPSDAPNPKQRVFYQWLIDRMDRIGYDEIPEYYMDAWKTLDPMQLHWGFIHEWHQYWRDWQSINKLDASPAGPVNREIDHKSDNSTVDITSLLFWLQIEALEKFKQIVSCIVEDNQQLLSEIFQSVDAITPIPCRRIPDHDEIKASILILTGSDSSKRKRLRTILRLLHHPDHGGNAEMFIRIEESFST